MTYQRRGEDLSAWHKGWETRRRKYGPSGYKAAQESVKVGKPEKPGLDIAPDKVTVIGKPGEPITLGDIAELLKKRGLNPEDWRIDRTVVNEWEAHAVINKQWVKATNHQLKVTLLPRLHLIIPSPARLPGPKYAPGPRPELREKGSELMVMLPDQQAPYHDPYLHEAVLGWLDVHKPEIIVLSGDLFDFPTISKHRRKAHELESTVQHSLDAGYYVVRDYVEAAGPECYERWMVPGNHEHRMQAYILEQLPQIYRLHRAGDEDQIRLLSLQHLSRLDELGFQWAADPVYEEDYPQAHVVLNDNLAIYHGWIVRSNSGESAHKTLETLGHSVMVGHTHRQSIVNHTYHEIDGTLRVLRAVEAGTLARVRGGLGYSMVPNWQPGFAGAWLHPDGSFNVWLASWVNGKLLYGNEVYRPRQSA